MPSLMQRLRSVTARSTPPLSPLPSAKALQSDLAERVATQVREQVAAAVAERDEAAEALKRAEEERVAAETRAAEERSQIQTDAEERAELIASIRSANLLPEEFETKGASVKDILVAAAGKEVSDAEKRSKDYLLAKVESIIERREKAVPTPTPGNGHVPATPSALAGGSVLTNVLALPGRPTPASVRGGVTE